LESQNVALTATDVYYDPYDRDIYADPYPVYRRLREEAPLYHNERYGFYAVSRLADVERVLVHRETFISSKGMVLNMMQPGVQMPSGLFIVEDPPQHTMHRNLVARAFTAKRVNSLERRIRGFCARAADALVGAGRFDFAVDLAAEIPIQVIGMLMGIPESDQARVRDAFHQALHANTADPSKPPLEGLAENHSEGLFGEYLDWRAEHPSEDMMTDLLNIEFEDETGATRRLRRDEILVYLNLIVSAGSDTTARLIGWIGKELGDHPGQRRELVEDFSLIPNAIEEILRFEPPPYHFARYVTKDVEFHGQNVQAGSVMVVLPGAANRDDQRFTDPETFDIHRKITRMFSFGFGAHLCLGASLARLEGRIALEEVLKRIPDWTVDADNSKLTPGIDTRGWDSLPVVV
jgi:cytochrome P450